MLNTTLHCSDRSPLQGLLGGKSGEVDLENDAAKLVYYERFVNDGSPTGLTFAASSSSPTSPLHCAGSFVLPFLALPSDDVKGLTDSWSSIFLGDNGEVLFPIHPDLVDRLLPAYVKQVVWQPKNTKQAWPTASPRSVLVFDDSFEPWFLKLDYPLVLGRFTSELYGEKLWIGPRISRYLSERTELTDTYFLPEIDALEAKVLTTSNKSGVVLRSFRVSGTAGVMQRQITPVPAFSLFSADKLMPSKKPLIISILEHTANRIDALLDLFIQPLLKSYWQLSLSFGLIPEAHAQNFLFGFTESSEQPIVIWRDFQGFYRDESWLDSSLGEPELGTYHLIRSVESEYAQQRRSFLFDWMLGHYFLDQIISVVGIHFDMDIPKLLAKIREITRDLLSCTDRDYLPEDKWYSMDLNQPKREQRLGMVANKAPKYR